MLSRLVFLGSKTTIICYGNIYKLLDIPVLSRCPKKVGILIVAYINIQPTHQRLINAVALNRTDQERNDS